MMALLLASANSYLCYWNTNHWQRADQIELVNSAPADDHAGVYLLHVYDAYGVDLAVPYFAYAKPFSPASILLPLKQAQTQYLQEVKRPVLRAQLIVQSLNREMTSMS